ncbi:MAG: exonuclease SbcCD subunit D [Proteobacteria bacterium]|nr:exonuclease SbcCD subunit D [Pseudomonadota bacterium]
MRLLHTSDWHIGRQFHNVSLLEDQAFILDQIVSIAADQKIDVMLLAGDVYDRSVPPASAVALLDDVFNRICRDLNIPLIVISGNHDGAERLAFGSRQMSDSGLHIISSLPLASKPIILEDQHGPVAFHAIPYVDPAVVRHAYQSETTTHDEAIAFLIDGLKDQISAHDRNVALGHLFLDGGDPSESERPLSLGGLDKVSADHFRIFNYAALGHLHGPQKKDEESIRYSGSILKYSFSEENQKKAVTIVEIDNEGTCTIEQIPLKPKKDLRVLEGTLEEILRQGTSDTGKEDYLLVRLTDTHAILDIMQKLREVYPNVLHLERPGLMGRGEAYKTRRELLQKGELSMFKDFFQQVSGEDLSSDQLSVIEKALEEIHQKEEP